MKVRTISLVDANNYITKHHRHNKKVAGHKFSLASWHGDDVVGVAIVGRPVARGLDNGTTLEVLRLCVIDLAPKGACSFLYGACYRAAKALGYAKLITYTLQKESGASLRGAGWKLAAELKPRGKTDWQSRSGRAAQDVLVESKYRWEVDL